MSEPDSHAAAVPVTQPWLRAVLDVSLVWLVFAIDGAWPIPDVNEAHYLTKAKHFWDPSWCARDLFLSSADTHAAFFSTFGFLTHLLPLTTAALAGRVLQWTLLAWGWRRLSYAVVPRFGWAALSGAAMTALIERLNLAGEWVVGGCEAKVVAYALLFSALADVIGGRWNRALVQLGGATLFHVLVGGWSLIALGLTWAVLGSARPPLRRLLPGLVVAALLSLGGLWPALQLTRGLDPTIVARANVIYVEERISHHLLPQAFGALAWGRHLLLWGGWLACLRLVPAHASLRVLRLFVAATGCIALVGSLIAFSPLSNVLKIALLRYYWFRLSDVMPAVGTVLEIVAFVALSLEHRRFAALLIVGGAIHFAGVVVERVQRPLGRGENLGYASNLPAWRDVCEWIKTTTPPDAIVLSPRQFYTFKWYAERADAGTWKDVPQDAKSIVAWRQRLELLYGDQAWINYVPIERIKNSAKVFGIQYVVAYRDPPLALPVAYQNNDFVVYELPQPTEDR